LKLQLGHLGDVGKYRRYCCCCILFPIHPLKSIT
jgi:hypothetical protein